MAIFPAGRNRPPRPSAPRAKRRFAANGNGRLIQAIARRELALKCRRRTFSDILPRKFILEADWL